MGKAHLNFDEDSLDINSSLYKLYKKLYLGTVAADKVDVPDYVTNPPKKEDGSIDMEAINQGMADFKTILMKNAAYLFSDSIVSVIGDGSGGTGGGSTSDYFNALYGFQAGDKGTVILKTEINSDGDSIVDIYGRLDIDSPGITIGGSHVFYMENEKFFIDHEDIQVKGRVNVGDIHIRDTGIFYGTHEFYHSGNSNLSTIDWNMKNGTVYGDLVVKGKNTFNGDLSALYGFKIGNKGNVFLQSDIDGKDLMRMKVDLSIDDDKGIKFGDYYVLNVRNKDDGTISLSAPGRTINLGDTQDGVATKTVALQTGISNFGSDYVMVSQFGDGYFPNSFRAGCGNAGPDILQSYYRSKEDCGVISFKKLRLGDSYGPAIFPDETKQRIVASMSYTHIENGLPATESIDSRMYYAQTTSLFKDQSLVWSSSLNFDTDAEFFTFNKPVESQSISIISQKYKTRLIENALFFDDGIYFEGVEGGVIHNHNSFFTGELTSVRFANGMSGYGFGIIHNDLYGGIEAVFDGITIRKKTRIYELEVRKSAPTNGSLWISDSCSGDLVEEIP